jgi:hypothetical protein
MDIEGSEYDVFPEVFDQIPFSAWPKQIMWEVHAWDGREIPTLDLLLRLDALDYRLVAREWNPTNWNCWELVSVLMPPVDARTRRRYARAQEYYRIGPRVPVPPPRAVAAVNAQSRTSSGIVGKAAGVEGAEDLPVRPRRGHQNLLYGTLHVAQHGPMTHAGVAGRPELRPNQILDILAEYAAVLDALENELR